MKNIKSFVSLCLLFLVTLIPINASADVFGTDDETWERVFVDLKKINSRLVRLETSEIGSLRHQLEDLLRQIEEVKQTLPQLQGSVEMNKSETISSLSKIRSQISDLDAEVRNQVLPKIEKQNKTLDRFQKDQTNLKKGLAQDIEQFEKMNKENFQGFAAANKNTLEIVVQRLADLDETTKKNFENTKGLFITDVIPTMAKENLENRKTILEHLAKSRENNEKSLADLTGQSKILIDILGESLKQSKETKEQIVSIAAENKEQIASVNKTLVITNNNLAVNNKNLLVADQKINKLAETLKILQGQHSISSEALVALKKDLVEEEEFDQLIDGKINKLVKNSAQLIANANKLEGSVLGELKQSSQKEDSNQDKINLANEKLSRLIEILKAIATEQDKLREVVKAQAVMNKAQAGLVKNQESIKEALADLRRKANVSISRSDDIKKSLSKITKNNSDTSSKSTKKSIN
jgi:DNA repair exonuclease SbcCD ATPase subunit